MSTVYTVEGELFTKDSNGTTMEFYQEDFVIDGDITNNEALSLIRKGLISERLQRKVNGFRRIRTCQLVDSKPSTDKPEDSELTRTLTEAINLGCVPQNIDNYKRKDHKLKALQKAIEGHKVRLAKKTKDSTQDLGIVDD